MIELLQVCVSFQKHLILDQITVSLKEPRIAVIGANGSGKSTFVRLLNGLRLPQSGSVKVDNLDTKKHGAEIRRKVGFVFQNPDNQIVMPVVEEDLAFGMKNIGLSKDLIKQRTDNILQHYGLEHARHQPAHLLSGGQKQLLAICGVLVMEPQIIIFDEPTTQLDLRNKRKIMETIEALTQQVIVVSHDLEMLHHFDRVLVFNEGKIICDDNPKSAIANYEKLMS